MNLPAMSMPVKRLRVIDNVQPVGSRPRRELLHGLGPDLGPNPDSRREKRLLGELGDDHLLIRAALVISVFCHVAYPKFTNVAVSSLSPSRGTSFKRVEVSKRTAASGAHPRVVERPAELLGDAGSARSPSRSSRLRPRRTSSARSRTRPRSGRAGRPRCRRSGERRRGPARALAASLEKLAASPSVPIWLTFTMTPLVLFALDAQS